MTPPSDGACAKCGAPCEPAHLVCHYCGAARQFADAQEAQRAQIAELHKVLGQASLDDDRKRVASMLRNGPVPADPAVAAEAAQRCVPMLADRGAAATVRDAAAARLEALVHVIGWGTAPARGYEETLTRYRASVTSDEKLGFGIIIGVVLALVGAGVGLAYAFGG